MKHVKTEIERAVSSLGVDWATCRNLHTYLCNTTDNKAVASLAAEMVISAVEHYAKGDQIMNRLAALVSSK